MGDQCSSMITTLLKPAAGFILTEWTAHVSTVQDIA